MVGAVGLATTPKQGGEPIGGLQRHGIGRREAGRTIGEGPEVGERRAAPALLKTRGHAAIAGVVDGVNRLPLPAQHPALAGLNRLPHRRTGMAWIAIHLALRIRAEVIAIHSKAVLITQGPGAGQHGLGRQGRRRRSRTDLVGHHPLEIPLQGHLLHQGPAAIGIALQPQGPGVDTIPPAQAARGLDLDWPLEQHGGPARACRQLEGDPVGGADGHTAQRLAGWRRRSRRGPHLPVARVGNHGGHTLELPGGSHLFGTLKTGERPGHQPLQAQGLRQRHGTPVQGQTLTRGPLASGIEHLQRGGGTLQHQGRRGSGGGGRPGAQVRRQRHPQQGLPGGRHGRGRDRPVGQSIGPAGREARAQRHQPQARSAAGKVQPGRAHGDAVMTEMTLGELAEGTPASYLPSLCPSA